MQHYYSLDDLQLKGAYVAIGTFDGVHRGHQTILRQMVEAAHQVNLPAVVVTFSPPPGVLLRGITEGYALTMPEERAILLGEVGVDIIVTLQFDRALAAWSAEHFMLRLKDCLGVLRLWVGYDFALGRGREGDIPALRNMGEKLGFEIHVISPVQAQGTPVSSSQVRSLLREGKARDAAGLLGRWYRISGPVVHGDGRGRTIGIPTANVDVPVELVIPANGVYATWVSYEGQRYQAVTNIGLRPTFVDEPTRLRIEALLLDIDRDLYDKLLSVEFVDFIRLERRFASVQELVEQIDRDRNQAREVLRYGR